MGGQARLSAALQAALVAPAGPASGSTQPAAAGQQRPAGSALELASTRPKASSSSTEGDHGNVMTIPPGAQLATRVGVQLSPVISHTRLRRMSEN